jgi:hypothetical protein
VKVYAEPSPPLHIKAIIWTPGDTRTGQIMPHRRSSDVASAVWLINEETTSRTFISPSVMAFTRVFACGLGGLSPYVSVENMPTFQRKGVTG